jgi:hypothetical protein
VKTLVMGFNEDDYRGKVDEIAFVNLRTGARWTIPYPAK